MKSKTTKEGDMIKRVSMDGPKDLFWRLEERRKAAYRNEKRSKAKTSYAKNLERYLEMMGVEPKTAGSESSSPELRR